MHPTKTTSTGEQAAGTRLLAASRIVTDNTTLTVADAGVIINVGTDAKTIALPAITAGNIGMVFGFRNIGSDGAVKLNVSPAATDGIFGTVPNAAADSVASGVVNKDFANTKATANKGDFIWLEAVAVGEWYATGGVGIWASEA